MLAAALVAWRGRVRSPDAAADGPSQRRLAAIGVVLVLIGLPWPLPTPPAIAVRAMVELLLGAALAALALGDRRVGRGRFALLAGAWAGVVLAAGVVDGGWAVTSHLEATSVPVYGNPVAASAESIARGSALWSTECASCHEGGLDVSAMEDREALEVITHGTEGMPGYAYRLDLDARGDVLNYLRAAGEP
jgi:mono/diheme cytochrome c family protein